MARDHSSTTPVRESLAYAALGLRVLPLHERSKTPRIDRWPERATTDGSTIRKWISIWPNSNLAIATGGGLVALDVDIQKGGKSSFKRLMKGRKPLKTAQALTGSGGSHYLFRVEPGRRVRNVTDLLPGVDIKGDGGMLVVEPSVHPTTGREYVWLRPPSMGISEAPSWLVAMLPEPEAPRPRSGLRVTGGRVGDHGGLLEDAVARFQVTGRGQRNARMTRLVASLLGRGFEADLVEDVVVAWWRHFHEAGVIGTPPGQAQRAVRANIEATLANPAFGRAVGVDHRARCREIGLGIQQVTLLREGVVTPAGLTLPPTPSKSVTSNLLLCRTDQERAYVEAWVVVATYKLVERREWPLKATSEQFKEIIQDRHGLKLANPQIERLKLKYIAREGKPATHCELAVQTRTGSPGTPSEYILTGLRQLLPTGEREAA